MLSDPEREMANLLVARRQAVEMLAERVDSTPEAKAMLRHFLDKVALAAATDHDLRGTDGVAGFASVLGTAEGVWCVRCAHGSELYRTGLRRILKGEPIGPLHCRQCQQPLPVVAATRRSESA